MKIYAVIAKENEKARVEPLSTSSPYNDVVFFAGSDKGVEGEKAALQACEAVALFYNRHKCGLKDVENTECGTVILPADPGISIPPDGHYYAYVYADPDKCGERFYCGKGKGKRCYDHFRQAMDYRSASLNNEAIRELAKLRRIIEIFERDESRTAGDICKIVASFSGANAELLAFAVEQFLIQHVCGVYNLTNSTNGNRNSNHNDKLLGVRWQSRPNSFDQSEQAMKFWRELLTGLVEDKQKLQFWLDKQDGFKAQEKAELIYHQFPEGFQEQFKDAITHHLKNYGFQSEDPLVWLQGDEGWGIVGSTREGDLSIEANVRNSPVVLQFKFSFKEIGCCINLRPGPRQELGVTNRQAFQPFIDFVKKIWGNAAVRNVISHPFLKPFSVKQNGREDIYFNAFDTTSKSSVQDCLISAEAMELTLPEAVESVVKKIREV